MMDDFNDKRLKELLSDSKVEMPFSDFENNLMRRVKTELNGKRVIHKNLRLSWLFFLLGSVFGLAISIGLPTLKVELAGWELQSIKYPLMTIVLFIIIWQLEGLIKLTVRNRKFRSMS